MNTRFVIPVQIMIHQFHPLHITPSLHPICPIFSKWTSLMCSNHLYNDCFPILLVLSQLNFMVLFFTSLFLILTNPLCSTGDKFYFSCSSLCIWLTRVFVLVLLSQKSLNCIHTVFIHSQMFCSLCTLIQVSTNNLPSFVNLMKSNNCNHKQSG